MRPSLNFYFKLPNSKGKQSSKLIFADTLRTFELDFETEEFDTIKTL